MMPCTNGWTTAKIAALVSGATPARAASRGTKERRTNEADKKCVIRMVGWLGLVLLACFGIVSILALPLGIAVVVFGVIKKSFVAVVAGAGLTVASNLMVAIGADVAEKYRSWLENQKRTGKW